MNLAQEDYYFIITNIYKDNQSKTDNQKSFARNYIFVQKIF